MIILLISNKDINELGYLSLVSILAEEADLYFPEDHFHSTTECISTVGKHSKIHFCPIPKADNFTFVTA